MRILALDTTLSACSVALLTDGKVAGFCTDDIKRGHAEALLPMVMRVCAAAEMTLAEIDRIAVAVGPGTFVGIRVGVAAARAFSLALDIPVTAITTLDALAATGRMAAGNQQVTAVIDARNDQFYAQLFAADGDPVTQAQLLQADTLIALIADTKASLTGPGAQALATVIAAQSSDLPKIVPVLTPDPRVIAQLAEQRDGQRAEMIRPLYLRPPDAKLPHTRTTRIIA